MKTSQFTLIIIGLAASMPFPLPATAHDHDSMVVIRDDCEPNDPGYAPTGGCLRKEGDVSFAEFGVELSSPLAPTSLIGHQGWRMDRAPAGFVLVLDLLALMFTRSARARAQAVRRSISPRARPRRR